MSAFAAAAQDEDGDEIKELQYRLNVAQECIRTHIMLLGHLTDHTWV